MHPFPSPLTALTPPFFRRKTVLALYRYLRCSLQVQTNGGAKQQSQANLASMIPWTSWFQPLMRITRFPGFPWILLPQVEFKSVHPEFAWCLVAPKGCAQRRSSSCAAQRMCSKSSMLEVKIIELETQLPDNHIATCFPRQPIFIVDIVWYCGILQ